MNYSITLSDKHFLFAYIGEKKIQLLYSVLIFLAQKNCTEVSDVSGRISFELDYEDVDVVCTNAGDKLFLCKTTFLKFFPHSPKILYLS